MSWPFLPIQETAENCHKLSQTAVTRLASHKPTAQLSTPMLSVYCVSACLGLSAVQVRIHAEHQPMSCWIARLTLLPNLPLPMHVAIHVNSVFVKPWTIHCLDSAPAANFVDAADFNIVPWVVTAHCVVPAWFSSVYPWWILPRYKPSPREEPDVLVGQTWSTPAPSLSTVTNHFASDKHLLQLKSAISLLWCGKFFICFPFPICFNWDFLWFLIRNIQWLVFSKAKLVEILVASHYCQHWHFPFSVF